MAVECAFIGITGAILTVQPGSNAYGPAAFLPTYAAFCYALYLVTMRLFDDDAPNPLLYIYASIASVIGATLIELMHRNTSPTSSFKQTSMILLTFLAGRTVILLIMVAYRAAPASALAPLGYFAIIIAFGFGWVFFW